MNKDLNHHTGANTAEAKSTHSALVFSVPALALLANGCLLLFASPYWPLALLDINLGGLIAGYLFSACCKSDRSEALHFVPAVVSVVLCTFIGGSDETFNKLIAFSMVFVLGQLTGRQIWLSLKFHKTPLD